MGHVLAYRRRKAVLRRARVRIAAAKIASFMRKKTARGRSTYLGQASVLRSRRRTRTYRGQRYSVWPKPRIARY